MRRLISLLLVLVVLYSVPVHAEESYDPQHTMLALNMAIVSVHRILATEDRIVLEQEYQNIINNLSLGNIESDYDLTTLYQDLLATITKKRLRDEDARILQSRYDQKLREMLVESLGIIQAFGWDIFSVLGSLVVSCPSAYFSYQDSKAELTEGLDGDLWQLKKEDITDCNALRNGCSIRRGIS